MEHLSNLPPLTVRQANAIEAWFACGSMAEAAAIANMSLCVFLDTLADEAVKAHLDQVRRATQARADMRLAEAAQVAIQTLENIAADTEADPTERRRAASTILRALGAPSARPRKPRPRALDIRALNRLLDRFDPGAQPPDVNAPAPESSSSPASEPPTRMPRPAPIDHDAPTGHAPDDTKHNPDSSPQPTPRDQRPRAP